MEQLAKLYEIRNEFHKRNTKSQQQSKYLFDKRTSSKKYDIHDLVLVWNARGQDKGKHGKFEALWLVPYMVGEKNTEDSYFLLDMNGKIQELPVHGQFLKHFFA